MAIGYLSPRIPGSSGTALRGRTRRITVRPRALSPAARARRAVALFLLAALTIVAATLVYAVWLVHSISQHLPNVSNLADVRLSPPTTVVTSDGVLLATLQTKYCRPVSLSEISPYLIEATIATEDSRFYQHAGVDFHGIGRALMMNLRTGDAFGQGGSTITQQLARNLYLTQTKSFRRKLEEMLLAHKIEQAHSKNEILEAYLNTVYYGSGSYGAEAAARTFFGQSARNLTLGEAALLAGLPQRPAAYSPVQHIEAALKRRDEVLARMETTGKITAAQEAQAKAEPLCLLHPHVTTMADWKAPYFVTAILGQLRAQYGQEFLYSGVQIETTLNWKMQKAAEHALHEGLHRGWGPNTGALVAIDPHTGFVRALVGGANFRQDQFDAATQGVRQPGSAFKPLVYAAAFDNGICDLRTTLTDAKLVYPSLPKDWVVHNYDGRYRGQVTVLDALRHSINTIAVQVCQATSPAIVAGYAQRLGLTTPMEANLPLALGASGVHPLELCSAYSAFANGGNRYDPIAIARITDAHGREIFQDDLSARYHPNFMANRTLDQINVALREVVLSGTGAAAASIPDARGKTGTTSSHRDAWFVGYTADLVTAVWMARTHKTSVATGRGGKLVRTLYLPMPGETGGRVCAPVWRNFMAMAEPLQQKVNLVHGIPSGPLPAPSTSELLASLAADAQQVALRQQQDQTDAAGNNEPPGYTPAQYGSGPIVVTAPPDDSVDSARDSDSEQTQNDSQTNPQPDSTEQESGTEQLYSQDASP